MNARKIANAICVFVAVVYILPLLAIVLPCAAAVWAYYENDDE